MIGDHPLVERVRCEPSRGIVVEHAADDDFAELSQGQARIQAEIMLATPPLMDSTGHPRDGRIIFEQAEEPLDDPFPIGTIRCSIEEFDAQGGDERRRIMREQFPSVTDDGIGQEMARPVFWRDGDAVFATEGYFVDGHILDGAHHTLPARSVETDGQPDDHAAEDVEEDVDDRASNDATAVEFAHEVDVSDGCVFLHQRAWTQGEGRRVTDQRTVVQVEGALALPLRERFGETLRLLAPIPELSQGSDAVLWGAGHSGSDRCPQSRWY